MEEEFAPCNSEVVFAPVPELAKILVVQGIKRVIPESRKVKTWVRRGCMKNSFCTNPDTKEKRM